MKKIQPWETDDFLDQWSEKEMPKNWEEYGGFDE